MSARSTLCEAVAAAAVLVLLTGTALQPASAQPAPRVYRICDDRGCRAQDNQAPAAETPTDAAAADTSTDVDTWRGEPVAMLQAQAQQGVIAARYRLGLVHLFGLAGEPVSLPRAARHLEDAAAADHAWAQFRLAEMYRLGQGVPRDAGLSNTWMFRAAQKGVPVAAFNVATMFAQGRGTTKDPAEADRWYQRAAEGGVTEARYALAVARLQGADPQLYEGFQLLKQAAQGGHRDAQAMLGHIYLTGLDTLQRDQREARRWLEKAATAGDRTSRQRLQELDVLEKEQRQHRHDMAIAQQETMKFILGAAVSAMMSPPAPVVLVRN